MARNFGCHVDGLDLSSEMIRVAGERVKEEGLEAKVRFFEGDCLTFQYPRSDYNLIYSRDVFLHIQDKRSVLATLRRNLAPDGRLLFTDYVRGPAAQSEEFRAYVAKYGYALEDLDSYRALLVDSGFAVMRAEDLSGMFIAILQRELEGLPRSSLAPPDILYLEERWKQKLHRAGCGEQGWALFLRDQQHKRAFGKEDRRLLPERPGSGCSQNCVGRVFAIHNPPAVAGRDIRRRSHFP